MSYLAPGEIIMNNAVLPYEPPSSSSSTRGGAHLVITPLGEGDDRASPNARYSVKVVLPDDDASAVDAQYVLELSGAGSASSGADAPAKFTTAPSGGGIGCDGRRSHGRAATSGDGNDAIFAIDPHATVGSTIRIVGGWASGHESVRLTEQVVMFVGRGIAHVGETDRDDDAPIADDLAMAELEEGYVEEERSEIINEIEDAEYDAVRALEERRDEMIAEGEGEGGGDGGSRLDIIEEAEDEIVGVLEVEKADVNRALDALREDIVMKQADDQKARHGDDIEKHTEAQRREAQKLHRIHHEKKNLLEDRMQEMRRRAERVNEARRDKLDNVMDLRGALKESVKKLKTMDEKVHEKARREHIKPPIKDGTRDLIKRAREKFQKVGINEVMRERLRTVIGEEGERGPPVRGRGDAGYHGDVGRPLHPVARMVIQSAFALLVLYGVVNWYLGNRRRSMKGRRDL
jgi:hypothetical protein